MAEYMQYDWRSSTISHDMVNESFKNRSIDRKASVEALKHSIQRHSNDELQNCLPQDEATLLKFLAARKFDVVAALKLLENHYWYRKRNAAVIFNNLGADAPDIVKALESALPAVLSNKDRKGRCVLMLQAINWDPTTIDLNTIYRAIWLCLEYLVNDVYNQSCGFVFIVDWSEFSFRQSKNMKPSILRLMIEGLQDCFPARFKGIHFIGQPWYVEAILAVIKQFLNEKTRKRIYVHGNNLSTLHDYVHKDILPAELGGEQPSYNPEQWLKILKNV